MIYTLLVNEPVNTTDPSLLTKVELRRLQFMKGTSLVLLRLYPLASGASCDSTQAD